MTHAGCKTIYQGDQLISGCGSSTCILGVEESSCVDQLAGGLRGAELRSLDMANFDLKETGYFITLTAAKEHGEIRFPTFLIPHNCEFPQNCMASKVSVFCSKIKFFKSLFSA